jgi:zinc D-Ala-D-Ala dipeptidase
MKDEFYPNVDKNSLFELGYLAYKSQHSRGCAVDVTLVPLPVPNQSIYVSGMSLHSGILPKGIRFDDNSVDMGTGFDVFDELAHTNNPNISDEARRNRLKLVDVMQRHGFENYSEEWWHFSFVNEMFPDQYFNFPIE